MKTETKQKLKKIAEKGALTLGYSFSAATLGLMGFGVYLGITTPREDEVKGEEKTYSQTYSTHAGRETLFDIDHDGDWDLLDSEVRGKPRQLFYKKGFGLSQNADAEVHTVEPSFFDKYHQCFP